MKDPAAIRHVRRVSLTLLRPQFDTARSTNVRCLASSNAVKYCLNNAGYQDFSKHTDLQT